MEDILYDFNVLGCRTKPAMLLRWLPLTALNHGLLLQSNAAIVPSYIGWTLIDRIHSSCSTVRHVQDVWSSESFRSLHL